MKIEFNSGSRVTTFGALNPGDVFKYPGSNDTVYMKCTEVIVNGVNTVKLDNGRQYATEYVKPVVLLKATLIVE